MRSIVVFSRAAALVAVLVLQACGGGRGGGSAETPPTPLPDALSVSTAATVEAGVVQAFASSATATLGLRFEWSFGDGTTSTQAAPSHAYASAGEYTVTLRISNEAGQSRLASAAVTVNRLVHLQGLQCAGANQTGWCRTQPAQFGDDAYDVRFVDDTHAWAVGSYGAIRKTTDGGRTWQEQASGSTATLFAVRMRDRQRGWILDYGSRELLRTVDGGLTWERLAGPVPGQMGNVTLDLLDDGTLFMNRYRVFGMRPVTVINNDYFSTDGGTSWTTSTLATYYRSRLGKLWVDNSNSALQTGILRSTNLGASFERVLQTRLLPRSTLTVFDEESVLVRYPDGDPQSPDLVERLPHGALTRDGGATWARFNPVGLAVPSIDFPPSPVAWDDSGWLVIQEVGGETHGPSQVSRDHGRTWQPLTRPRSAASGQETCRIEPVQGPLVACIDGYVNSTRQMWLSTDRGATWREAAVPNPAGQFGPIQRVSADTLIAPVYSSALGIVWWITRDLGRNWSKLLPGNGTPYLVSGHWALSPRVILRSGSSGSTDTVVDRSTDGGLTWQRIPVPGGGFQFVSDRVGWLFGATALHRTTDAGLTWAPLPMPPGQGTPWFLNDQRGYLVDFNGVRVTDDGGATWQLHEPPGSPTGASCAGSQPRFFDANEGVVVRYGVAQSVLVSRDGGRTCTPKSVPGLSDGVSAIALAGNRTAWVLNQFSGGVARSTDRGETWELQSNLPALPAGVHWSTMFFLDADRGWLAAPGGHLAVTRDGGATWQRQTTPSMSFIYSIQFIDDRTGWINGSGFVIGTGTGGN